MRSELTHFRPGDHAAFFYRNRTEQFEVVIPYILEGLCRNERCLYIVAENTIKSILDALEEDGVDVKGARARGALVILTAADSYLRHGVFEPEKMIEDLTKEVELSIQQGFSAFRATGELSWSVTIPSALARIHEYEAALDTQFPQRFLGLCQYNENAFSPNILAQVLRVHPKVVARGVYFDNPFYINNPGPQSAELPRLTIDTVMKAVLQTEQQTTSLAQRWSAAESSR